MEKKTKKIKVFNRDITARFHRMVNRESATKLNSDGVFFSTYKYRAFHFIAKCACEAALKHLLISLY